MQKVLPKATFEERLPEGWYLSRLYKGRRVLYFDNIKVASLEDTFNLETDVFNIINNPPECAQAKLYEQGKLVIQNLSTNVQKKLIKAGIISYEVALNCLSNLQDWLERYVPRTAEYAGNVYTNRKNRWYDCEGNCINSSAFFSIWDARVKYAKGLCTIQEVARYSWAAVLECLGDDHQRFVNQVLIPKLELNKKAWVIEAKQKRASKNKEWCDVDQEYQDEVNSTLKDYFNASLHNHVQMFTESCNVPAFRSIHKKVQEWEANVINALSSIKPELVKFKWNVLLRAHEPVFAPQMLNAEKRANLFELVHQAITGQMSGHEAALRFTNAHWKKIIQESKRYGRTMSQYVPFYSERINRLKPSFGSFRSSVNYVIGSIKDLMCLGFRESSKTVTAFNYDDCRFTVDVISGSVNYLGPAKGKYMSDSWLKLKPEQRRKLLGDDSEWTYQEKAIKRYRKLFSYLYNVVHKHWDRASYYEQDKLTAKRKYLHLSSGFLDKLKARADQYIKSLERRVVTC